MRVLDWIAGVREYRLAAISAIAISLLLVLLIVAPSWFIPEPPHVANKAVQPETYALPAKPARNIANKSKENQTSSTHKTGEIPISQRKKSLSMKAVTDHQTASVTKREMKDKNRIKDGYYVQIGAFKDAGRGRKLASSLQHSGWHVQVIRKKNDLHAVLAGPLKTRKKAENAKLKLAKQSGIRGFIIFITPGN